MYTAHPDLAPVLRKEERLRSLHRVLTWGGSSAGFLWILFWLPFGPVFGLLILGAVLFTPYLVIDLARLGKHGWTAGFALLVLLPIGWSLSIGSLNILNALPGGDPVAMPKEVTGYLLFIWPLVAFYCYTFILRHSVENWLEEARRTRKDLEAAFGATAGSAV